MEQVAIVVPGIMGSVLKLGTETIWPGSPLSLISSYKKMAQLMDDGLVATDLIRSYTIFSEQYQGLINDLATCGFIEKPAPPAKSTLFVAPYDWRKSNSETAKTIADKIDEAVALHGGDAEISLISHSMGGLISRFYLESGEFSARPGFSKIRRLLTLGTPHRGSPLALTAALGKEKRLFLSAAQVKELCSDTRFPSLYELLPPPGEPFAWDERAGAEYAQIDIYKDDVATGLKLVKANLDSVRTFHSKLDLNKCPKNVRYFFFVGTRQTTISSVRLRQLTAGYEVRRTEFEDAGDGTVPSWSGTITGIQGQPVGGEHGEIYKNNDLRRTMAVLLGKAGVLAAPLGQLVEVSLRERVVYPDNTVHVALTFSAALSTVNGELRIEKAILDASGNLTGYASPDKSYPIQYSGLAAEKLGLTVTAPNVRGFYRVAYYPKGAPDPVGYDELFLQEAAPPPP